MFSKQLSVGLFRCCFEIRGFINKSRQHCIYIRNKDKEKETENRGCFWVFCFLGTVSVSAPFINHSAVEKMQHELFISTLENNIRLFFFN